MLLLFCYYIRWNLNFLSLLIQRQKKEKHNEIKILYLNLVKLQLTYSLKGAELMKFLLIYFFSIKNLFHKRYSSVYAH